MSGSNLPFDGELNGLIKEYLEYFGLENACDSFVEDCKKLGIPVNEPSAKSKKKESLLKLHEELLNYFDEGNRIKFFSLWTSYVYSKSTAKNKIIEELEFQLQIHFAIFPFRRKSHLNAEDCETAMCYFRSYLETKGTTLSQSDDLLPYYALPFIPNPQIHPSFKKLFEENWVTKLRDQLESYLFGLIKDQVNFVEQPCLVELYKQKNCKLKENSKQDSGYYTNACKNSDNSHDVQNELNTVEMKWKESERKNNIQAKQLIKLQEDCHMLMTVLNNFIAALESAVKGDLTDLDDVLSSCMQRFPEVFNLHKTTEIDHHQNHQHHHHHSKHKILPKSIKNVTDTPIIASLDFTKMKNDILHLDSKRVALLLQALRWRITKQSSISLKITVVMMYIEHDILNFDLIKSKENFLEKVYNSTNDILQTFLRFLNAIASFPEGRDYLASPEIIDFLLKIVSKYRWTNDILYRMSTATLIKLTESYKVRKGMERVNMNDLIQLLSEEKFTLEYNSTLLIKLFLNLFSISSVRTKYKEELKKLKIICCDDKNIDDLVSQNEICNLKHLLNNNEEEFLTSIDNSENSKNSILEIEQEIDDDDPVTGDLTGEEFLEKHYNIDFLKEKDIFVDKGKHSSRHLNVMLKQTRRSKSVPLVEDESLEKSPSTQSLSESITPKLDPEATEMVRKIIGETSKTLVEATTASHPSPVHIKGLNSKEYTLAFSSRPKIPRTPEPGESTRMSTPSKKNFKVEWENSRQTPISPRIASSSPPKSTRQHLE